MKKIIIIIVVVLIVGWFALGVFADKGEPEPPNVDKAAYQLVTESRNYYMNEYEDTGDTIIIQGFYSFDNGKWHYHKGELNFPKEGFLRLEIKKRG